MRINRIVKVSYGVAVKDSNWLPLITYLESFLGKYLDDWYYDWEHKKLA